MLKTFLEKRILKNDHFFKIIFYKNVFKYTNKNKESSKFLFKNVNRFAYNF